MLSDIVTMSGELFARQFNQMAVENYRIAVDHGWYDEARRPAEHIAMMHSELSECLEAYRIRNPQSLKTPLFSCAEEELADTVIRIMNFAFADRLNVGGAVVAKMKYNNLRPFKHSGKVF